MDCDMDVLSDSTFKYHSQSEAMNENYDQAKLESIEKKAVHLRLVLEKDFKAADMKWSLFVAAAFSFRYETCLKPFPPGFIDNGVKNMDKLLNTITDVPALDLVLRQLNNLDNIPQMMHIVELLFYVLVRLKEPTLKTISDSMFEEVLTTATVSKLPAQKPQHVFQVVSSNKSVAEIKWRELSKNHIQFNAFHGNHIENFYSMLHFGLQAKSGNGIQLTPELYHSLSQSQGGYGWGASCIGSHLMCVGLVEFIDAPEVTSYQQFLINDNIEENNNISRKNVHGDQCATGSFSHYKLMNGEVARLRYLLVYSKSSPTVKIPSINNGESNGVGLGQWISHHKLLSLLLGYGIMLASIGVANNQPLQYYFKIFLKKIEIAYSSFKI